MKKTFEFKTDFKTGGIIFEPISRLYLASGNIVRIYFTPDGMKLTIPKSSLDNGDIALLENIPYSSS